ncbi:MAG: hypothetical protein AAFQ13_13840 [Pseudomonadota bacterium]
MRSLLVPIVALALMGAHDEAVVEIPQTDEPALLAEYQEKLEALKKRNPAAEANEGSVTRMLERSACRDRLEQAEDGAPSIRFIDRPLFQGRPDTPENPPLAIYAVDRREDGCGMMVMMGNPDDVRPVPSLDADDHRLMPAEGNR